MLKKRPLSSVLDDFGDEHALKHILNLPDEDVVAIQGLSDSSDQDAPPPIEDIPKPSSQKLAKSKPKIKKPQPRPGVINYASSSSSSEDQDQDLEEQKNSPSQEDDVFAILGGTKEEKQEKETWKPGEKCSNSAHILDEEAEGQDMPGSTAKELFTLLPAPKKGEAVTYIVEQEGEGRDREEFKAPLPRGPKVDYVDANKQVNFDDWLKQRRRELMAHDTKPQDSSSDLPSVSLAELKQARRNNQLWALDSKK